MEGNRTRRLISDLNLLLQETRSFLVRMKCKRDQPFKDIGVDRSPDRVVR